MAGGKGSRIRPLTLIRPKPMIPVANRPMIDYIIENLNKAGFKDLIVTLNYLASHIKKRLKKEYKDFNIKYSLENQPLGTAGGVKKTEKYIDDTFLVLSGDVLIDLDLKKVLSFHHEKKAIATLVLTPVEDPSHFGVALLDDNQQIIRFLEKPSPEEVFSNIANTGTYILEPEIFDYIQEKDAEVDFSKDVFPKLIEESAGIYGYTLDGYWNDVGRPETYLKANQDVLQQKISPKPPGKKLKEKVGVFGDIWVGKNVLIDNKVRIIGPVVIGDGCIIEKGSKLEQNTVLGNNVHLEENSTVKGSVILSDTLVKSNAYLEDCIIDSKCIISSFSVIEKSALLGSSVNVGSNSVIKSDRSITNKIKILPHSTVDSDYPLKV